VAKLVGTWLGLSVPLLVPLLIGMLIVILAGVPFDGGHWTRFGALLLAGSLYFTFFIAFGLAVSALTRRSSTSFLVLLSSWILLVLVVPRAGVVAAVELVPIPSVAQIESRKEGFRAREWDAYRRGLSEVWRERQAEIEAVPEEEREAFEDEKTWAWMEQDEQERKELQARVAENSRRINEEIRAMKTAQQRIGLSLSRISPASMFQLVALDVSGTGLELQDRYVDAIGEYRSRFNAFVEEQGGNRLVIRAGGGHDDEDEGEDEEDAAVGVFGDQGQPIDLREMPRFTPPELTARAAIAPAIPDLGLLGLLGVVFFGVAFAAFLRYDVRP
jgi:hypothetical protein